MTLRIAFTRDTCASTPTKDLNAYYYWTKTLKIVITTILTRVCPCTCLICYPRTHTGLNMVRFTNTK